MRLANQVMKEQTPTRSPNPALRQMRLRCMSELVV